MDVIEYHSTTILASKTIIIENYSISLCTFFKLHLTTELFCSKMLPTIERLLLRSPETALLGNIHTFLILSVVTNDLLSRLEFDCSDILQRISEPLLNQTKSSSEILRLNAVKLLTTLLSKSKEDIAIQSVASLFINQFSKNPSLEQRASLYSFIPKFPDSALVMFLTHLPAIVAKESNEAMFTTVMNHVSKLVYSYFKSESNGVELTVLFTWIASGLNNTTSSRRSAHLEILSRISTLNISKRIETKLFNAISSKTIQLVQKVKSFGFQILDTTKKDVPAFSEGLFGLNYILNLIKLEYETLQSRLLNDADVISLWPSLFTLNEKLYTKACHSIDEELVMHNSIMLIIELKIPVDHNALQAAVIYLLVNARNASIRKLMGQSISDSDPSFTIFFKSTVLEGVSKILKTAHLNEGTTRSSTSLASKLYSAIKSVIPNSISDFNRKSVVHTLMDFCVICSHPIFVNVLGNDSWIRLCIRSDLKPEEVLESDLTGLLNTWISSNDLTQVYSGSLVRSSHFYTATLNALQLFNNISEEAVSKLIYPWILSAISDPRLKSITQREVLIWMTPATELFFDPLAKKTEQSNESEEKWEKDLKAKLKSKQPSFIYEKLSKKDKELVDKQRVFENGVRSKLSEMHSKLVFALEAFDYILKKDYETDEEQEETAFGPFVFPIISSIITNLLSYFHPLDETTEICSVFSDIFLQTYFKIARSLSTRFSSLMVPEPILCGLLFRLSGSSESKLPAYLCVDSIQSQLTTFLTTLKAAHTPATPFLPSQFTMIFPVLQTIIMNPKTKNILKKNYFEFLLQSAEILLSHASLGECDYIPTKEFVECLLHLMSVPKVTIQAREALVTFCSARTDASLTSIEISRILLDGLNSPTTDVRCSCLDALQYIEVVTDKEFCTRVWRLKYDEEEVKDAADVLWEYLCGESKLKNEYVTHLVSVNVLSVPEVALAGALALVDILDKDPGYINAILETLYAAYALNVRY